MNLSVFSLMLALIPAAVFAVVLWCVLRQRGIVVTGCVFVLGGVLCHVLNTLLLRAVSELGVGEGEATTIGAAAADAFLEAAFPEELARFLVLLLVCALLRCWSRPAEVVQHCAMMSLGFAGFENVFYAFISTSDSAVLLRVIPTLSHGFDGVIMGFLLVSPMLASYRRWIRVALAVSVPVLLHFLFDFGHFSIEVLSPKIDALDVEATPTPQTVALLGTALVLMSLPPAVWIFEAIAASLIVRRIRRALTLSVPVSPSVVPS